LTVSRQAWFTRDVVRGFIWLLLVARVALATDCVREATFTSINCRLDNLAVQIDGAHRTSVG